MRYYQSFLISSLLLITSVIPYDFSDFDLSSLKRSPYGFCSCFAQNLLFLCRDDPYSYYYMNVYYVRFNIFDVVGNWQGNVCDTTDCVAQAAFEAGACMCLALNSTANSSFYDDGTGIETICFFFLVTFVFFSSLVFFFFFCHSFR